MYNDFEFNYSNGVEPLNYKPIVFSNIVFIHRGEYCYKTAIEWWISERKSGNFTITSCGRYQGSLYYNNYLCEPQAIIFNIETDDRVLFILE